MRTTPNKRHKQGWSVCVCGAAGVGGGAGVSDSSKESQGKEEGMNTRKARNGSCSTFKPKPLKDIFTVTSFNMGGSDGECLKTDTGSS